jgi:hypothetical protein
MFQESIGFQTFRVGGGMDETTAGIYQESFSGRGNVREL